MPEHTGEGECSEAIEAGIEAWAENADAPVIGKPRRLRYTLKCSIGPVPGAEHVTGDLGHTDDLETAIWHSEHSEYPGWDVYDNEAGEWVGGGGPPEEFYTRTRIQAWIAELSVPGWAAYPYIGGDAGSQRARERASAEWLERYPDWKPAPESILAPLRCALYVAMARERKAADRPMPGQLAGFTDGRDLTPEWQERYAVKDRVVVLDSPRLERCEETVPGVTRRQAVMVLESYIRRDGRTDIQTQLGYATVDGTPALD